MCLTDPPTRRSDPSARFWLDLPGECKVVTLTTVDARNEASDIAALGMPVPVKGQFVVCRVVPSEESSGAEIQGSWWRVATTEDPVIAAPIVPRRPI